MFKLAPSTNVLRLPQVKAKTGLGRSTIYAQEEAGVFPPSFCLGPRAVGWIESEVDAVLATARAAGATVHEGQQRAWGGYSGYFVDPEGFRWEVAFNPHPIGGVTFP